MRYYPISVKAALCSVRSAPICVQDLETTNCALCHSQLSQTFSWNLILGKRIPIQSGLYWKTTSGGTRDIL